jgi:hypothetical protein
VQLAEEAALPWCEGLATLPTRTPEQKAKMAAFTAELVSYQHPDHDTVEWNARS